MEKIVKATLRQLNLPVIPAINRFSSHRNLEDTSMYKWIKKVRQEKLNFEDILKVQEKCQDAMKIWGYRLVSNKSEILAPNDGFLDKL